MNFLADLDFFLHQSNVHLFIKHSYLLVSWSKCFSRCLLWRLHNLVQMHFEVTFHSLKSFEFTNRRRRWNGAILGPWYLFIDFNWFYFLSLQVEKGWLEPLLVRIIDNPKRLVCPVIENIRFSDYGFDAVSTYLRGKTLAL